MTKNPVVVFRNNNKPTGNIAVTKQWVKDRWHADYGSETASEEYLFAAAEKSEG